jgi:hypothetical protein
VFRTPGADPSLANEAHAILVALKDVREKLDGDETPAQYGDPTLPGIRERVNYAVESWNMTAPPTQTQRDAYDLASADLEQTLATLRKLIEEDLRALQRKLDEAGVPWTPGRLPTWKPE